MVMFADMKPQGIGVDGLHRYPLVVLFFVVARRLMNRVFMIEQPDDIRARDRLRMADLAVGRIAGRLGNLFRTLLEVESWAPVAIPPDYPGRLRGYPG